VTAVVGSQSVCLAEGEDKNATAKLYIEFGERHFNLAYSAEENGQVVREYLPEGDNLEHWNELMSVHVFPQISKEIAADGYLTALAADVEGSNPAARYAFLKGKNSDQMVLDFLVFGDKPDSYAEWNLMRADYTEGKGLTLYQYAKRYYTENWDAEQAAKSGKDITDHRDANLDLFEKADFQEKQEKTDAK
jgi:hypothetical protein